MNGAKAPATRRAVACALPFPEDIVLTPVSRWPTRLAAETVQTVLESPLPIVAPGAVDAASADVSVVILTRNNLVFNILCLNSVLIHTDEDYELIVVDNASTDGTADYLRTLAQHHQRIKLVLNETNLGFAAANNLGIFRATGETLVLLNNDTIVPPGWLTPLLRHLENPDIGLVGPVSNRSGNETEIEVPYHTYGDLIRFARERSETIGQQVVDVRMLAMFCVAMRREVFDRVGALDERFEVGMFEDEDYVMRARAAGYRIVCAENAFVHHFGQATLGTLAATEKYGELFHANRRRFEEKWGLSWQPHQHRAKPDYQAMVERIRAVVDATLPVDATVLVVSRGDDELLNLDGRPAWHFPQNEAGAYAGHHPADGAAVIAALEALRRKGAGFLVLPRTGWWWLDHYTEFSQHLQQHSVRLTTPEDSCLIFALEEADR